MTRTSFGCTPRGKQGNTNLAERGNGQWVLRSMRGWHALARKQDFIPLATYLRLQGRASVCRQAQGFCNDLDLQAAGALDRRRRNPRPLGGCSQLQTPHNNPPANAKSRYTPKPAAPPRRRCRWRQPLRAGEHGGGWGGGWWVGGVWGWGVGGGVQPGGESRGSARVGGSGTLPRLLNTADGNHATYQTGRACFSPPPCPIPFVSAQSLTDIFYGGGQHEARRGGAGGERTRVPHAAARTCADGGEASEALSGSRRCKRGRPG